MRSVGCEQLRYTWAERRLNGNGPGFGVVLRSRGWPEELEGDPELWQLLTELSLRARRLSPDASQVFVTHLRRAGGALLVAKRPVGTDGAGRPGNYCVHALFDPTATLGALDLELLLADGTFALARDVTAAPRAAAEPVQVRVPEQWAEPVAGPGPRPGRGVPTTTAAAALHHWDVDELRALLSELCQTMPADLVNQFEVVGGDESGMGAHADDGNRPAGAAAELYRSVTQLGATRQNWWWRRRGLPRSSWDVELDLFLVLHQPVSSVPDARLWDRWDRSDATGRAAIADELLDRPALLDAGDAVDAVAHRPSLVDDLIEAGLTGPGERCGTAARWIAAVGTDAQVVDLAAELLAARPGSTLPAALVDRLTQQQPDELPPRLVDAVAAAVDGVVPAAWRLVVLQAYLRSNHRAEASRAPLAEVSSDEELRDALRLALANGTGLDQCWHRLGDLVPTPRRDRTFAAASSESAAHLLRHASPSQARGRRSDWATLWPLIAASSGWSPLVGDLLPAARRRETWLQRQRLILLIAAGLLAATVLVLLLLLRLT